MNDFHDDPDHHTHDDSKAPRWLRLATTLRAEPDAATLAHVHARLAARSAGPAWVRWLSRPLALAASAALLVASAFAGSAMLSTGTASADDESLVVSTLLGDDGSYGLPVVHDTAAGTASGAASTDSEAVAP